MSPEGFMQSVRAGVLLPLTSSADFAFTGVSLRKSMDACWGRDTYGSTFASTANDPRLRLQCGWPSSQHQQLTLATHALTSLKFMNPRRNRMLQE